MAEELVRFRDTTPLTNPYAVPADQRWAGPVTGRRPKPLSPECLQALNAAARAKQADFPGDNHKAALTQDERDEILARFA
jgi:hypothetical protein